MIAVFVARADQPAMLHAHLPLLIKAASLADPTHPPISLVSLPKRAEERLVAALKVARVGIVGFFNDAPRADALLDLVRLKVSPVEVPWLEAAMAGKYLPVQIRSIETTVPVKDKSRAVRQDETGKKN